MPSEHCGWRIVSLSRQSRNLLAYVISSSIFQAGGLIVVVVEVTRKAYLASLVPVIVDAILNEHQVIADIVAFVSQGDFPRSRLGEKQRGKVLGSWVTRKLRTIAQFSIRDMEGSDGPFADSPQRGASKSSKPGSMMSSSMRKSSAIPESESTVLPRSPGPVVLEEEFQIPSNPYYEDLAAQNMPQELDASTDNVPATPVPEPTSAIPHIQEPQSATVVSEDSTDYHIDPMAPAQGNAGNAKRDFRFSFDIINTPVTPQPQNPAPATEPTMTGRASLPSQQPERFGSFPAGAGSAQEKATRRDTQDSGLIEDWPQEALMYQSTLDDGQNAEQHTPSNTAAPRYDGREYEGREFSF